MLSGGLSYQILHPTSFCYTFQQWSSRPPSNGVQVFGCRLLLLRLFFSSTIPASTVGDSRNVSHPFHITSIACKAGDLTTYYCDSHRLLTLHLISVGLRKRCFKSFISFALCHHASNWWMLASLDCYSSCIRLSFV